MGTARRPYRMPKQNPPNLIRKDYGKALVSLAKRIRPAFAQLEAELPTLMASALRTRGDGWRVDAGESKRVRELIAGARATLSRSITTSELEDLAQKFATRISTYQRMQLSAQVKAALGTDVLISDQNLAGIVDGFIQANVSLIESISPKVAHDVEDTVLRAVQTGTLHPDLAKELDQKFGYGIDRAKAIARDQVGKAYGQINAARQKELGVSAFIWRTVKDERVRGDPGGLYPKAEPSHFDYEGKRFTFDDPPEDGLPGEAINCRCFAEPDFSEILGIVDPDSVQEEPVSAAEIFAPKPVSESEAPEFFNQVSARSLTAEESQAVFDYQGGRYSAINDFARTGTLDPGSPFFTKREANQTLNALDSAIQKGRVPRDVTVYRGVGEARQGIKGKLVPGSTITDQGYSSTSVSESVAQDYAKGKRDATVFEISIPKGSRGAFIPGDGSLQEGELLLPRGSKFQVISVEIRDGLRVAKVRLKR